MKKPLLTYTTLTLPEDNNVYLVEENPYIHCKSFKIGTNGKDCYENFQTTAIATKKILINPVEGKTQYNSDGLKEVWQHKTWEESNWHISPGNTPIIHIGLETRQALQYIGKGVKLEKKLNYGSHDCSKLQLYEPTYTQPEVLSLLKKMKELCAERMSTAWHGGYVLQIESLEQSILSINENELLK